MRFQDEEKLMSDFYDEVSIHCPSCTAKAITKLNRTQLKAELICVSCGIYKERSMKFSGDTSGHIIMPAHQFFKVELWYQTPFKDDYFWALNESHLLYLERYIAAELREHKNRKGFTLIEKLPKFYHEAKNREALLKAIKKLKLK